MNNRNLTAIFIVVATAVTFSLLLIRIGATEAMGLVLLVGLFFCTAHSRGVFKLVTSLLLGATIAIAVTTWVLGERQTTQLIDAVLEKAASPPGSDTSGSSASETNVKP